jgi:cyclohexanecarboxylate-CoA ligase
VARKRVQATRRPPQAGRYLDTGAWEGRLVDEFLIDGARRHPNREAVIDRDRRLTYAQLAKAIEGAAGLLARLGVRAGDVVSFQLPNWLEAALVHYGAVRLGAVSNPISPIYRAREVEFIVRQAHSRVLVIPDVFRRFDYREMAAEVRDRVPDLEHVLVVGEPDNRATSFAAALGQAGDVPDVPRAASDVALLLYTSGTEASPKGVLHSHDTLAYECRSIIELYEATAHDRVFMPSPVTHITGLLYGLQLPFMLGTAVVLQDIWATEVALDLIERERCSFCIGATPFLHGLVHAAGLAERDMSCLRVFGCGGADIPPALIYAAHEQLAVVASRLYGSTECPTVTGTPLRSALQDHADTDGSVIGESEMRVVDDLDQELPAGRRGDLQVRGPDLCLGYLDAALNHRAFTDDGWFRTGDLAVIDARGRVQIAGRSKDIILRGGENLSAKEIEDLLFEHPAVEEVAVVGYPDEVLGERACAFVVGPDTLTLGELVKFLRARQMATQKLPERLRIVSALPKTASGKVQKFRLRERLRAEADGGVRA